MKRTFLGHAHYDVHRLPLRMGATRDVKLKGFFPVSTRGSAIRQRLAFNWALHCEKAPGWTLESNNKTSLLEGQSFDGVFMNRTIRNEARKTILVVEDDKQIASALYVRLKASGYDVVTATDGFKGLSVAMDLRPNLIVMDIWLPGAIGFVVAERLKDVGLGGLPIIFMTASKKEDLWRLAQEVGSVAFFQKPYDPDELLAAIARQLDDNPTNISTNLLLTNNPKRSRNEKNTNR